jgi:hypothetical protein
MRSFYEVRTKSGQFNGKKKRAFQQRNKLIVYSSVSQPVVRDDGTGGPQADLNLGLQSRERPFIIEKRTVN